MNRENKELLLEDFFARKMKAYVVTPRLKNYPAEVLSYEPYLERVKIRLVNEPYRGSFVYDIEEVKLLLIPVDKLTEDNRKEFYKVSNKSLVICPDGTIELSTEENYSLNDVLSGIKWLDEHNIDHRGLIDKGLALELTIDMIKNLLPSMGI